ncbi:hypothetical protein ACQEVZ_49000 [Dactylosporangium sp. CA-152071]|uniref:hypothetical protein n=1 Tax=Dactylosporangium sp. CA-152071 TaxID=3239933 RepID=UPI003D9413B3
MRRRFAAAAVVTVLAAAGCDGGAARPSPNSSPNPSPEPSLAAVGGPVPFSVKLGAGQRLIPLSPGPQGCPGVDTRVHLGDGRLVRFTAYATGCPLPDDPRRINGRHGVYRSTADIPADLRAGATSIQTPLGEATAFTQDYSEYTNSANHYTEPVAVITLARPADPAYQTLTVIAEKGTLPMDELATVLREQLLAP